MIPVTVVVHITVAEDIMVVQQYTVVAFQVVHAVDSPAEAVASVVAEVHSVAVALQEVSDL